MKLLKKSDPKIETCKTNESELLNLFWKCSENKAKALTAMILEKKLNLYKDLFTSKKCDLKIFSRKWYIYYVTV